MSTTETNPTPTATDVSDPWFLRGGFGPVTEEVTATSLEVEGALPPSLAGRYVRTGPNPVDIPDVTKHHWFVGDGMVHGVRLLDGRADWYRNRFVLSPAQAARTGREPVPAPEGQVLSGSGNTNVIHHAGRMFAINELSLPYELSDELDTVRQEDFGGPMPAGMTAHPKFDPATGEMHVMAYHFLEPWLRYHVVDAGGQLARTEEIAMGGPVMVHDMALTEEWAIVFDLPVVFDLAMVTDGRQLPYRWDPDYRARVGLLPRNGSADDTVWIDLDPCYVFHPLNAYDEDGRVVIDLVVYQTMFAAALDGPLDNPGQMQRWVLDPAKRTCSATVLDERAQEFPRADERLATRRHRYGYAMHQALQSLGGFVDEPAGILKYDVEAGTVAEHVFPTAHRPGEFVFVPDGDDAGEDEGWLVGYVYDAATDRSDFVVLDATDITAPAVATVHLPVRVPVGFHGNWIPDRALT